MQTLHPNEPIQGSSYNSGPFRPQAKIGLSSDKLSGPVSGTMASAMSGGVMTGSIAGKTVLPNVFASLVNGKSAQKDVYETTMHAVPSSQSSLMSKQREPELSQL